jgi:hypothetical protein
METEVVINADKLKEALVIGTLIHCGRPVHEAEQRQFMNWALAYRSRSEIYQKLQRIYNDEIVPYYGADDWWFAEKPKICLSTSELS